MQINNFDKVISDVQKLHESIDKLKEDLKNLHKNSKIRLHLSKSITVDCLLTTKKLEANKATKYPWD